MNSREMTHDVRLRHWAEVLREQKASGQGVNAWCEAHGIGRQRFFYWQRKLREAACALVTQEMPVAQAPEGWALCAAAAEPESPPSSAQSDQLCIEIDGIRILAGQDYPEEKLARLLRKLATPC
jgi:transposase-like protein